MGTARQPIVSGVRRSRTERNSGTSSPPRPSGLHGRRRMHGRRQQHLQRAMVRAHPAATALPVARRALTPAAHPIARVDAHAVRQPLGDAGSRSRDVRAHVDEARPRALSSADRLVDAGRRTGSTSVCVEHGEHDSGDRRRARGAARPSARRTAMRERAEPHPVRADVETEHVVAAAADRCRRADPFRTPGRRQSPSRRGRPRRAAAWRPKPSRGHRRSEPSASYRRRDRRSGHPSARRRPTAALRRCRRAWCAGAARPWCAAGRCGSRSRPSTRPMSARVRPSK